MEVTTRLLSFMCSHAWLGMESETTKCTSTPSANLSLEKCSVNASMKDHQLLLFPLSRSARLLLLRVQWSAAQRCLRAKTEWVACRYILAHLLHVTHTSCIRSTMLTGPMSPATNAPASLVDHWLRAILPHLLQVQHPVLTAPPSFNECCSCSDTSRSCSKTGSSINHCSHCREPSYKYSHTNRSI